MAHELILLVDDEPNIIELASMYLRQDGFRVISAGDGLTALERAAQDRPALMVLDLMLPRLDGWEVCKRIRTESDLLILMLTARDEDIDKIVGLELGADDYLTKLFNPRELDRPHQSDPVPHRAAPRGWPDDRFRCAWAIW